MNLDISNGNITLALIFTHFIGSNQLIATSFGHVCSSDFQLDNTLAEGGLIFGIIGDFQLTLVPLKLGLGETFQSTRQETVVTLRYSSIGKTNREFRFGSEVERRKIRFFINASFLENFSRVLCHSIFTGANFVHRTHSEK